MKIIKIDKKDWPAGLEKSRGAYRLIGPVMDAGGRFASKFRELDKGELPDLSVADTVLSPKSIAFPQSETMFEYTTDETSDDRDILKRPERDYSPTAVIGIRPCDAASFLILKKNFDTKEYRDPYWADAYESCVFIGLAADDPLPEDFSPSVGSGPFDESGLDVLLANGGDFFLAKVITDKGEAYLKAAGWETDAGPEAAKQLEDMKAGAEKKISSAISFDRILDQSILDLYDADFWDDAAFACLNCGTCAYVCPTCWCFDIQDETRGHSGQRNKLWDACMFPLFSVHASGHNPRSSKTMRARQRFMHKLKYYPDKYNDGVMCVGCGRCVRLCPVNIDIRKVCERMNSHQPAEDAKQAR
ncbi:4Fe-4S ferredoxin [Candidatus Desulfarcum epimagneticum]|uniref:4Fe-4S ferredoxin n=1 Tax=uncultured Desulfobacteraceae bacterium TaxID=218296 RepID=A0A484HCD2_9BACT|nr:4Fe-4S ferredoxin [uncultured Desulfobacteraceae bacterium]